MIKMINLNKLNEILNEYSIYNYEITVELTNKLILIKYNYEFNDEFIDDFHNDLIQIVDDEIVEIYDYEIHIYHD